MLNWDYLFLAMASLAAAAAGAWLFSQLSDMFDWTE